MSTSPPGEEREQTSDTQSTQSNGKAPEVARSIYSFWGNGAGPSKPTPAAQAAPAKRKRRKDDGAAQGRLTLKSGNEGSWAIAKAEEGEKGAGRGRAKGGEEDEMKDMSKRAKQAAKPRPARRGNRDGGATMEEVTASRDPLHGDSSCVGETTFSSNRPTLPPSKKSPAKRRRTARQQAPNIMVSSPPSPEVIAVLSSDPVAAPSPSGSANGHTRARGAILSRTTSKGAPHDPIDIEQSPTKGPRKLVFAADQRAAHPLFARVAAGEVPNRSRATSVLSDTARSDATVKTTASTTTKGKESKTHSFFSMNGGAKEVPGKLKDGWGGGVVKGEEWPPPWLEGELPSHQGVAGPSMIGSGFKRRKIAPCTDEHESSDFWSTYLSSIGSAAPTRQIDPSINSKDGADDTAKSPQRGPRLSDRETWCERYRPVRADDVLGNVTEARYIRDWLQTLSVGDRDGASSRKVKRKARRYKEMLGDDWLVDDLGLFGDPQEEGNETEEEEYVEYQEPELPLGTRPKEYPPLETAQLTNTLLLAGPSGAGKSAAVHAAATELDWEVFEVYPGLGKRTGGNLMGWVGDVGRNHLVVKGGKKEEPKADKSALKSFFGKAAKEDDSADISLPASQGSAIDPIEVDGADQAIGKVELEGESNKVRQSLILIDEADILFSEENSFWPAVVSLIAESRRPVIITCNDPALVPKQQLPLQVILHFQPPPADVAVPYLATIASQEGISEADVAGSLYERCLRRAQPALPVLLAPNGHEPLPRFDLRQAIMQLQLERDVRLHEHSQASYDDGDVAEIAKIWDTASFVDAYVEPRLWSTMETAEIDRHGFTGDDQLGVNLLVKPRLREETLALPAYDQTESMAAGILECVGCESPVGDLQMDQILYVRSLLPLLDPLIPLAAPLLPSPALILDVLPVLQQMIQAEDVLKAAEEEALANGEIVLNRKTGKPKRATRGAATEYERYFDDVDEIGLAAARSSTLT